MKVLHVVGRKNHGKTLLVSDLVSELAARGVRVGVIKHCGHEHELDTPGKDSFLHRQAGATPVAVLTPSLTAVYRARLAGAGELEGMGEVFAACDVVLIEGYVVGPGPKMEVWRAASGAPTIHSERGGIACIASDDPVEANVPVYPRRDIAALADKVLELAREI
jgi:molybdopterin-guanine dinucleotide biosynthesis protein B